MEPGNVIESRTSTKARLIALIEQMPEDELALLLKEVEERLFIRKRKHARKTCSLAVEYSTRRSTHSDFIHDISAGGVFIETSLPFRVGERIILNFTLPNHSEPLTIRGETARISPSGIGVQFKMEEDPQAQHLEQWLEKL